MRYTCFVNKKVIQVRLLFFENLFNEPADSRFPKIRIKKIGFLFFFCADPKFESAFYFV